MTSMQPPEPSSPSRPPPPPHRRERAVAFVVVRLSSSRLPAKQFRTIGDRRLIDWTISFLRNCRELDDIVITTVAEKANEPLRDYAAELALPCYWYEGEVDHVTNRLRTAAEHFGAEICVLVSGDCPLLHPESVDVLIDELRTHPEADAVQLQPDAGGRLPALQGVGVFRKRAWQRADDLSNRPELREHHFPVIGLHPEEFSIRLSSIAPDLYLPSPRFSVDTWADLEFLSTLHDKLSENGQSFSLPAAVSLLREAPQFHELNIHVHQRRLVEDIRQVLMVVDAGMPYGYGHFMRSLELGLQLTERLSWPVAFLVDDEKARNMVEQRGMRTIWGAFERESRPCPGDSPYGLTSSDTFRSDLVVLDVFAARLISTDWRNRFENRLVAVLDQGGAWAEKADLHIVPGVTGPLPAEIPDDSCPVNGRVLAGEKYIILRREIRRAALPPHEKDLDIVAYLHDEAQRRALREYALRRGLRTEIMTNHSENFTSLLARARFFVGSFGMSFYEALGLYTLPVAWPLTPAHERDARLFYERLNMHPFLLSDSFSLETVLSPLLHENPSSGPVVQDGTPNIVDALHRLVVKHKGDTP